jgi:hypothetical protein
MTYRLAFIRNISKFLWIPLVVDFIIGFATALMEIKDDIWTKLPRPEWYLRK